MKPFVQFQFRFAFRRWARSLSIVLLGLGLTCCATARGTVSGGRRTSPDERVSLAVPALPGGGKLQKHHDASYFAVIGTVKQIGTDAEHSIHFSPSPLPGGGIRDKIMLPPKPAG